MPGTLLAERYRLGATIGTGASAHVFEAHDERLGRRVAIKVLDDAAARTADPAARQRFAIESRTAAQFIHPNAVTVFDAGTDDGTLYVVMELVTGGSLAEQLARSGPLSSADVTRIGAQVASALDAAHTAGIIHRDVKPANVLLDHRGDAKLADFGIARRLDEIGESLTSTGMVMGTRQYVSPEQSRGETLGPASDVFSLGVTLYEAVSGVRPPSVLERAPEHRLDVRAVVPSVDPGLADAIAKATVISAAERCPTARAMADALTAAATRSATRSGGGTAVMPAHLVTAGLSDNLVAERRHRRRVRTAGVVAALAVAALVVAAALGPGDSLDDTVTTSAPAKPIVTSAPVTTAPATTAAPTTVAPTTAAPTTVAPTTVAPTAPPTTPPLTELIPGFPIPADIDEFLDILENDPNIVGPRGEDLLEQLDEVLTQRRGNFEDNKNEMTGRIEEWRDDGELDPVVAVAAIAFLDAVDEPRRGNGNGNGGGDD